MGRRNLPIHVRMLLFAGAFLALQLVLAALATIKLVAIDDSTHDLRDIWVHEVDSLNEVDDHLADLRFREIARALATTEQARASHERAASSDRESIDQILADLSTGPEGSGALAAFRAHWKGYALRHDRWVREDAAGDYDAPARPGNELEVSFMQAHESLGRVMTEAANAASASTMRMDELIDSALAVLIAVSVLSVILAVWSYFRMRATVTAPLSAITTVMSRLAEGDRSAEVPELHRGDEIGALAKAFDVFRANALALEKANEAAVAAQEQAQTLARHDALTGLPNRRVFAGDLEAALATSRLGELRTSVLMIDLDRFKPVNDLYGHGAGDTVLCEVARRVRDIVRKGDTIARLGGDEFAVVCQEEQDSFPKGTVALTQRVLGTLAMPIRVGDGMVEIGASIGIASSPAAGAEDAEAADPEEIMRAADIAMYDAKRAGRGTYRFFERSMDAELRSRATLEADLRAAILEGRIEPYYQPLVTIPGGVLYGFEVLARWHHSGLGMVSPDVFIPLAEQMGLIAELTWSILRQSCRQAVTWPAHIRLSVNISPIHLKDATMPMKLLAILNQEHFEPSRLEIEVTETALVSDIEGAKLILASLQSVGIKVALDDFGTGYSSLYHLRELKFDKVKIDRSFVQSIEKDQQSRQIVEAIISLARNLELPTIAEGVEDQGIVDHLTGKGCEFAQGYHFGRPMTGSQASELLKEQGELARAG
jgi:diguanylate cyclase (GGDEF)-like protein